MQNQGGGKFYIKEFLEFVRPKICLFITGIAATGYLLFNPLDSKLIYVTVCSFFAAAAGYTYNQLTDKREDSINKKKLNLFVLNNWGRVLVGIFLLLSFIFSLFISKLSILFFIIGITTGMAYSALRIKEIFLLKNVYTALVMPIPFLVGAAANSSITLEVLTNFLIITCLVFIVSLLGDLRDREGDKAAGVKTVSVVLGYHRVKNILSILLGLFVFLAILSNFKGIYLLIPFISAALFFLRIDDLIKTRICILSSFILLPIILFIMKTGGV